MSSPRLGVTFSSEGTLRHAIVSVRREGTRNCILNIDAEQAQGLTHSNSQKHLKDGGRAN